MSVQDRKRSMSWQRNWTKRHLDFLSLMEQMIQFETKENDIPVFFGIDELTGKVAKSTFNDTQNVLIEDDFYGGFFAKQFAYNVYQTQVKVHPFDHTWTFYDLKEGWNNVLRYNCQARDDYKRAKNWIDDIEQVYNEKISGKNPDYKNTLFVFPVFDVLVFSKFNDLWQRLLSLLKKDDLCKYGIKIIGVSNLIGAMRNGRFQNLKKAYQQIKPYFNTTVRLDLSEYMNHKITVFIKSIQKKFIISLKEVLLEEESYERKMINLIEMDL